MKKKHLLLSTLIAIGWVTFHIYTAINGMLPAMQQRIIHLSFALSLSYSLFPLPMKRKELFKRVLNILLPFIPLVLGAYFLFHMPRLDLRIQFVDTLSPLDLFAGFLYLLLLLEISRRIVGKMITYLALVFIVYALAGPLFPGLLGHRGLDFPHLIDLLFYSTDGIFGIPVGVAADYVFYFVIFGAFFYVSGGGQLFNDIAFRLTKRSKGGPAKAAVISSSLMGSVSGSAVANVASTGIFTIPLMKKAGYSKKDSAAIESLASTGGQLMPPIMGAAVFIMAEMIGIPYVELIVAAMIPAFLYYVSLLIIVHLKASKEQLSIVQVKESMDNIIIRLHLLLPLILLVTLIFTGYSLHRAAIWAIGAVIILGWARKPYQLNRHTIIEAINKGAKQAIHVTIPCAIAGIIVGVIGFTGLGLKFTSLITLLSSDIMIIALILTAGGCILLGMGMPTTSAYIMGAILLAPALQAFSIGPLASHMFVLYFAVLSMITPPIALASYSAAGISGSKTGETGLAAFKLSLSAFIIPFAFVYNESLLMQGSLFEILWNILFTTLGIAGLSSVIIGYIKKKLSLLEKAVLFISSLLLITPHVIVDLIGALLYLSVLLFHLKKKKEEN